LLRFPNSCFGIEIINPVVQNLPPPNSCPLILYVALIFLFVPNPISVFPPSSRPVSK
jgi:hypothetical protein